MISETALAPYLLWAKTRQPATIDLAGSNLLHCSMEDLPGARGALELSAPNDNGYAPIVQAIGAHYGVDPARVVSGTGCSGANFIVVAALVGAGDDVLVERPTYDPLIGACRLMGANIVRVERQFSNGFQLDPDDVRRSITPRTRLIIVTSPHNPSGVMLDSQTLSRIAEIAAASGANLLVDEVYLDGAGFVRESLESQPKPGASRRGGSAAKLDGPIIVTSSLTKSYGLAGLRSGWAIAPANITERLRRTRDVIDNASSGPSDRLAALAWSELPRLAERARTLLSGNVARAREFFLSHPQLEVAEPPHCSVVFPRIAGVPDSEAFVQSVLSHHGVALAPGRFFESPAHFRVSLAGRPDMLEAGLARLSKALQDTIAS